MTLKFNGRPRAFVRRVPRLVAAVLAAAAVSGCGWVDSTGRQSSLIPNVEVLFNDGTPFTVAQISEGDEILITSSTSDREGVITTWRWDAAPRRQGNLDACVNLPGFSEELASRSLADACVEDGCAVNFEQREVVANDGESVTVSGADNSASASTVQFIATMPSLRAPVGLTYDLVATDSVGGRSVTEHTFCVDSVNQPPVANDDVYTVMEGGVLSPNLDERNLLSNDTDDLDIRNLPLSVLPDAVTTPSSADNFQLFPDGSFAYSVGAASLTNNVEDRFVYEVTDGSSSAMASVVIRVVAVDDAPVLTEDIPLLIGIVGIELSDDFTQNVQDPEGATLTFTADPATLPPSGDVTITEQGRLVGMPAPADIGEFDVAIRASDGTGSINVIVPITIIGNAGIEARAIPDQNISIGERFSLLVGSFFTDPESQDIAYRLEVDDPEVNLTISNGSGFVTGFVSEPGNYVITLVASDGVSQPTRSTFELTAVSTNQAPEFDGPAISSQTVVLRRRMVPVSANISDADEDALTFSIRGTLPDGVELSAGGTLSGRPTERGTFAGLRIVGTDPDGESATTNVFTLFVR